jgi:hypothetical protein
MSRSWIDPLDPYPAILEYRRSEAAKNVPLNLVEQIEKVVYNRRRKMLDQAHYFLGELLLTLKDNKYSVPDAMEGTIIINQCNPNEEDKEERDDAWPLAIGIKLCQKMIDRHNWDKVGDVKPQLYGLWDFVMVLMKECRYDIVAYLSENQSLSTKLIDEVNMVQDAELTTYKYHSEYRDETFGEKMDYMASSYNELDLAVFLMNSSRWESHIELLPPLLDQIKDQPDSYTLPYWAINYSLFYDFKLWDMEDEEIKDALETEVVRNRLHAELLSLLDRAQKYNDYQLIELAEEHHLRFQTLSSKYQAEHPQSLEGELASSTV